MMRVIANRQITGEYGSVVAGQAFDVRDELAEDLMKRNLVRTAAAPRILYDTKVIQPAEAPEVGPREPFRRNVPVPNQESPDVAPEGDRVLPEPDVHESEPADLVGRGLRSRSAAGRR
jgi:hypothetical protein